MKTRFTKIHLESLPTIQQSHDGDYLKIESPTVRVWLTHENNKAFHADYQVEKKKRNGFGWTVKNHFFKSF